MMLQHLAYMTALIESIECLLGPPKKTKVVAAVSGGMDSMALLFLLHHMGYDTTVVHVNYHMRGEDSNEDEHLVKEVSRNYGYPCLIFDARHLSTQNGNFQQNARDFRYEKLEQTRKEVEGDCIVTAHHMDDDMETFLFKFIRNSYLFLPHGMEAENGRIKRPLLSISKSQLKELSEGFGIRWREDASNGTLDYARNRIRNRILPEIMEIHPFPFSERKKQNQMVSDFLHKKLQEELRPFIAQSEGEITIFNELFAQNDALLLLQFALKETPFSSRSSEIHQLLNSESGKMLLSKDMVAHKERRGVVIRSRLETGQVEIWCTPPFENEEVKMEVLQYDSNWKAKENEVVMNADNLVFPLIWRSVRPGDSMQPLGMSGRKKISDILIEKKVETYAKQKARVLLSNDEIVWCSEYRISEVYKITDLTKQVLVVRLK